jgi:hypothetical protein
MMQAPAANAAVATASARRLRRDGEEVMPVLLRKKRASTRIKPRRAYSCESVHNRPTTIT